MPSSDDDDTAAFYVSAPQTSVALREKARIRSTQTRTCDVEMTWRGYVAVTDEKARTRSTQTRTCDVVYAEMARYIRITPRLTTKA